MLEDFQYVPVKGKGVGNETPFVFGNPYRRVRQDNNGWFILVKGKKIYTQVFFSDTKVVAL
jgi:hypothetical protein